MDYFSIIAIALGLSFDTFAVSLSYGVMQNKNILQTSVQDSNRFSQFFRED